MHLFGRDDEPHLVHFEAHRMPHYVTLTWDVRHAPALSWRVLRSETAFAADAAEARPSAAARCWCARARRPAPR